MSRRHPPSAVLVVVHTPARSEQDVARSLEELTHLLGGLGVRVAARVAQRRSAVDPVAYLGEGKLLELAAHTGGAGVVARGPVQPSPSPRAGEVLVVVDDELTPSQHKHLAGACGVEVLDRTDVILRVFEARASTRAAKLEIERARIAHELPRVRDDHSLGDREGGGGRASRGASNVELKKRELRARALELGEELAQLDEAAQRARAARSDVFRVALVGYTNAGKSSLLRALTGAEVLVEDKLFATLDVTARQLAPPSVPPIVCLDTVGFLQRLPHGAFAAFRATLREAMDADLVLHVVDATAAGLAAQVAVSEGVLREVGAPEAWLVLNKIDGVDDATRAALARSHPEAIAMSALAPAHVAELRARIERFVDARLDAAELVVPYTRMHALASARSEVRVVREDYGPDGVSVTLRGTPRSLGRVRKLLGA